MGDIDLYFLLFKYFFKNKESGGALYIDNNNKEFTIVNNTFWANSAMVIFCY